MATRAAIILALALGSLARAADSGELTLSIEVANSRIHIFLRNTGTRDLLIPLAASLTVYLKKPGEPAPRVVCGRRSPAVFQVRSRENWTGPYQIALPTGATREEQIPLTRENMTDILRGGQLWAEFVVTKEQCAGTPCWQGKALSQRINLPN